MSIITVGKGTEIQTNAQAQDVGGSLSISRLSDVQITNLANGQILQYNTSTNKWENVAVTITDVDGGTY
tara:strand:- start:343 stop:549 length:207 start_codon:yes stop_codon:yes gene_type:complete